MAKSLCKYSRRDIKASNINKLVSESTFFCGSCARSSNQKNVLCKPVSLAASSRKKMTMKHKMDIPVSNLPIAQNVAEVVAKAKALKAQREQEQAHQHIAESSVITVSNLGVNVVSPPPAAATLASINSSDLADAVPQTKVSNISPLLPLLSKAQLKLIKKSLKGQKKQQKVMKKLLKKQRKLAKKHNKVLKRELKLNKQEAKLAKQDARIEQQLARLQLPLTALANKALGKAEMGKLAVGQIDKRNQVKALH
ncbi:hypothetical protein [Vibrio rumoiensis]|uniref:Uncharacterized protein n=1 Tax=Vibrio rumoiensis 1S-45 TaxID=1188252 RepID=A0A1E5E690_9VIBR|nr:hypothetical protein [Vibrio rumoiensis]OEF30017.1 hypothetical protein A1QC_03240 [Vibrio rumoiensis 1S-45]